MSSKQQVKSEKKEIVLEGISASPGIVIGPCYVYREPTWVPEPRFVSASKVEQEIRRFRKAVASVQSYLNKSYQDTLEQYGKEIADIIAMQLNLLNDKIFLDEVEEAIRNNRYDAAYATFIVFRSKRDFFLKSGDEYLQERAFDIQALKKLVIKNLLGRKEKFDLKKDAVFVAEDLSPTEAIQLYKGQVLGFATDSGGKNSHVAILARSLSVPAVVGLRQITEVATTGDKIVLDGSHGKVIVNPSSETEGQYQEQRRIYVSVESELLRESTLEAKTKDGKKIRIFANIEFEDEVENIQKLAVEGIGLFRTEGIFLQNEILPTEDEQTEIYTRVARAMYPKPVVIRTLDIGGDKIFPAFMETRERNPFLGWRAIRLCLDRPELFIVQLKAILRANFVGNVKLMIPMVSCISEIWETKKYLKMAVQKLKEEGKQFGADIELGIMVEIPSVVMMADAFAQQVDFFSIGTNDLVQYILALDRGNEKVAKLYSYFHPAVIKMIKMTIDAGKRHKIPVSMCGEMAGDPVALPLLLAMGLEDYSASQLMIPEIKRAVRELTLEECNEIYHRILHMTTFKEIKAIMEQFYLDKFAHIFYM